MYVVLTYQNMQSQDHQKKLKKSFLHNAKKNLI